MAGAHDAIPTHMSENSHLLHQPHPDTAQISYGVVFDPRNYYLRR